MAARTPEEKALSDVERAIKDYEKAVDKRTAAEAKADEARAAEHRALRTLEWTARHPDLAEDFNLAEFQQSLQEPFDDVEPDEGELAAVAEGEAEEPEDVKPVADVEGELDDAAPDDDDPFQ